MQTWLCACWPAGYWGLYTNKAGKAGFSVREGSATFFRASRFSLVAHRGVTLKQLFPAKVGGCRSMKLCSRGIARAFRKPAACPARPAPTPCHAGR